MYENVYIVQSDFDAHIVEWLNTYLVRKLSVVKFWYISNVLVVP